MPVLRITGEVVPLVGIVFAAVEFFSAAVVVNVMKLLRADDVIVAMPVRRMTNDRRKRPVLLRIVYQRSNAATIQILARWQPA
jgi:hypothetical protein